MKDVNIYDYFICSAMAQNSEDGIDVNNIFFMACYIFGISGNVDGK